MLRKSFDNLGIKFHKKYEWGKNCQFYSPLKLKGNRRYRIDDIDNVIEEAVDLARQMNLEVDSVDVLELLDSDHQE